MCDEDKYHEYEDVIDVLLTAMHGGDKFVLQSELHAIYNVGRTSVLDDFYIACGRIQQTLLKEDLL